MSNNNLFSPREPIIAILRRDPRAIAYVSGSDAYPSISGTVRFYQTKEGILVYAHVKGLPYSTAPCQGRVFGFHIHEGTACGGNASDPFADVMGHFNPHGCDHPYHAGDLPPLFGNNGSALSIFLTNRFTIDDVVGRVIIIHDRPDDFTTQPSGNSGTKIACGIIRKFS